MVPVNDNRPAEERPGEPAGIFEGCDLVLELLEAQGDSGLDRLRAQRSRIGESACRLYAFLCLSGAIDSDRFARLDLTEIADSLGSSPERVRALLRRLREAALLEMHADPARPDLWRLARRRGRSGAAG